MIYRSLVFIFGLCLGSFLNVCIYRLPLKLSIVRPGSFCPQCKTPIRWYENIPLFSYLFLRGRCRTCQARISLRYPVVEFLTAFVCSVLFSRYGLSPEFYKLVFFFSLIIVLSFIDIDYHAVPMNLLITGIAGGLLFSLYETALVLQNSAWTDWLSLPLGRAFSGMIVAMGFTYMFKLFADAGLTAYLSWRKKESIEGETESLGLGDVDFLGMVGVFLGWKAAILTFFIAPFCALGYTLFALLFRKSHVLPYVPYLGAATAIVFFWGEKILNIFLL